MYSPLISRTSSQAIIRILAKQKPGLKIIHLNAQSLAITHKLINSNIDVICVSETWFISDVSNMSIMCESFILFRSDRSGRGEGVAIYINKKLNAKRVCVQPETSAIEYIFLSIFNKRENT